MHVPQKGLPDIKNSLHDDDKMNRFSMCKHSIQAYASILPNLSATLVDHLGINPTTTPFKSSFFEPMRGSVSDITAGGLPVRLSLSRTVPCCVSTRDPITLHSV